MQYFITYVLGHLSVSGKKADTGTVVHKALEALAGLKKYRQLNPDSEIMLLNDDVLGDLKIGSNDLMNPHMVEDILHKSYDYYTTKSSHRWTRADEKTCLQLVWDTLNFGDGQFDPRLRNIIDPEPHFDIPIEEDWAKYDYTLPDGKRITGQLAIKGTIDLVTELNSDVIEVVDWKTGRRLDWATGEVKDYKKLCNDAQLLLYNYAITKLYPQYKQSIMTIFFVKDGGPFSMCFDRDDNDKFLKMLRSKYETIKKNDKPRLISPDRSSWKCSKLCHYAKNNWPGTNKSICEHVDTYIKINGIDRAVKDLSREGHTVNFYEAPG